MRRKEGRKLFGLTYTHTQMLSLHQLYVDELQEEKIHKIYFPEERESLLYCGESVSESTDALDASRKFKFVSSMMTTTVFVNPRDL